MSDIIAIELSSLDGLDPTPTQLQVVPSFHDQKLSFTFTVPRRRIWNATLVHCKILRLELSEFYIMYSKQILMSIRVYIVSSFITSCN